MNSRNTLLDKRKPGHADVVALNLLPAWSKKRVRAPFLKTFIQ